jgi:hypothetical protein
MFATRHLERLVGESGVRQVKDRQSLEVSDELNNGSGDSWMIFEGTTPAEHFFTRTNIPLASLHFTNVQNQKSNKKPKILHQP